MLQISIHDTDLQILVMSEREENIGNWAKEFFVGTFLQLEFGLNCFLFLYFCNRSGPIMNTMKWKQKSFLRMSLACKWRTTP